MLESLGRTRKLLPAALLLLLARSGRAEEAQVSETSATAPDAAVAAEASTTLRPAVSVNGEPGVEIGVISVQAAVSVRIPLGRRTSLTPGLSYQGQLFHLQGMALGGAEHLHSLEAPIVMTHVLAPKWSIMGRVSPSLSGDFESVDRHFGLSTAAMAMRVFSPRLVLGLGAALNYGDGEWLPLPVLMASWQATDRLRIESFLPLYTRALVQLGKRWEMGAAVQGESGRWALGGDMDEARSLNHLAIDAGGTLAVRVAGNTWLNVFSGWNAFRRYEVEGGPQDGTHDLDPGFVVRAGLEVRLPGR
jgi:hypothetical protein